MFFGLGPWQQEITIGPYFSLPLYCTSKTYYSLRTSKLFHVLPMIYFRQCRVYSFIFWYVPSAATLKPLDSSASLSIYSVYWDGFVGYFKKKVDTFCLLVINHQKRWLCDCWYIFHIVLNLYFELSYDLCIISQIFVFYKNSNTPPKQTKAKQTNKQNSEQAPTSISSNK